MMVAPIDGTNYWWLILTQGILAIIFGVFALAWPGLTLFLLIIMFGAYTIADGIAGGIDAAMKRRWSGLIWGVISIAAGVVVFAWPGLTALTLLYVIIFWAIVRGVFNVVGAFLPDQLTGGRWLLVLNGIWSILFGILAYVWPGATVLAIIWIIGVYAIVTGAIGIVLSFKVKGARPMTLVAT